MSLIVSLCFNDNYLLASSNLFTFSFSIFILFSSVLTLSSTVCFYYSYLLFTTLSSFLHSTVSISNVLVFTHNSSIFLLFSSILHTCVYLYQSTKARFKALFLHLPRYFLSVLLLFLSSDAFLASRDCISLSFSEAFISSCNFSTLTDYLNL